MLGQGEEAGSRWPTQPTTRGSGRWDPSATGPAQSTQTTVQVGATSGADKTEIRLPRSTSTRDGALGFPGRSPRFPWTDSGALGYEAPLRVGAPACPKAPALSGQAKDPESSPRTSSHYKSAPAHGLGAFRTGVPTRNRPVTPAWLPACSGRGLQGCGWGLAPGNLHPVAGFSRKGSICLCLHTHPEQPRKVPGTPQGGTCSERPVRLGSELPTPPCVGSLNRGAARAPSRSRHRGPACMCCRRQGGYSPPPTLCPAVKRKEPWAPRQAHPREPLLVPQLRARGRDLLCGGQQPEGTTKAYLQNIPLSVGSREPDTVGQPQTARGWHLPHPATPLPRHP